MELLTHDVIESILERIDAKTLVKFKSVSKLWRSTIQSPNFQQRQLIQQERRQSREDPDLLLVSVTDSCVIHSDIEAMRTLVLGSSSSVQIPTPWENKLYDVCKVSCDGLVYLYDFHERPSLVVNPITRWYRTVPLCNYQLWSAEMTNRGETSNVLLFSPGFGKDKIKGGTYKSVWLYNSSDLGLNHNLTTCEVFDFVTNSWRYVPASPYRILHPQLPVYVDGSLHWFTAISPQGETMVLSFDLHTETFQIISKAPFVQAFDQHKIDICNLDGRLCVSEEKGFNQVIWSFDSVHKTWNQIYYINLNVTIPLVEKHTSALLPLGILGKDKLLLFYDRETGNSLVTFDPKTKSYHLPYTSKLSAYALCYFPSLISIL